MAILVTGAAGFLGGHLVERLALEGKPVRALCRGGKRPPFLEEKSVEVVQGDVTETGSLTPAMRGVETVFHLAGLRRAASREPFMRVNAEGTRNVCEALVAAGGRRLILCSSLAANGPSTAAHPHEEGDPLAPSEWYGESKAEAERIALGFGGRLAVTVVRPPRIVGPRDVENLTFFRLVSKGFKLSLSGGPRPLTLVDVEDVVDLLLLAARHPRAEGQVFFVPGFASSLEHIQAVGEQVLGVEAKTLRLHPWQLRAIGALADAISRLTGNRLPFNRKTAAQLLAPAWTCSGKKAREVLGFEPKRPLDDSLRQSVLWYREQRLL
jgi:nucleoside-diphosphate-sugar epimerase